MVAALGAATTHVGAQSSAWTAAEQQLVYEINLARRDPSGYLAGLGYDAEGILPRPPLAMSAALAGAADFRAADLAVTDGTLGHRSSDGRTPNEVVIDYGYLLPGWWPVVGNSVETLYGGSGGHVLAAVLASEPHRTHLLGQAGFVTHREIGVGESGDGVWWSLLTGMRADAPTLLTGVVFVDRDGDGRMDAGEGLEGVRVTAIGLGATTSGAGGGWALAAGDGEYVVRASGGEFEGTARARVVVAGYNVGIDFVSGEATPLVWEYGLCRNLEPTILGSGGDDVIRGTAGRDVIHGFGGNDTIYGLGGRDVLCGGAGRDALFGGGDGDVLFGGPGNDELAGGTGVDRGQGGAGADDRCSGLEQASGCEG